MKFGKEDIQKMFLGSLVLVGLLYYYFYMLLGPLNKQEQDAKNSLGPSTQQLDEDKATIKNASVLKASADAADATLEQIKSMIPNGAPVAWFPPLITEFFSRQGIDKCIVHHGDESMARDLPGFKAATWSLDITHVEVVQLSLAIAAFENEHPLMEIDFLQIQASKDNVQYQTAKLNVSTIIKQ